VLAEQHGKRRPQLLGRRIQADRQLRVTLAFANPAPAVNMCS
jgi:hypothetical protein